MDNEVVDKKSDSTNKEVIKMQNFIRNWYHQKIIITSTANY